MVAKMTSKNQITIPKAISKQFPGKYFDVRKEADRIILIPLNIEGADQVRTKLDEMGITEKDLAEAVAWARR
jgi:AbrB family looped-hinge helix DNA binding protein